MSEPTTTKNPNAISESSIARIAGNIMSGLAKDYRNRTVAEQEMAVAWSVHIARAIAAEVERPRG